MYGYMTPSCGTLSTNAICWWFLNKVGKKLILEKGLQLEKMGALTKADSFICQCKYRHRPPIRYLAAWFLSFVWLGVLTTLQNSFPGPSSKEAELVCSLEGKGLGFENLNWPWHLEMQNRWQGTYCPLSFQKLPGWGTDHFRYLKLQLFTGCFLEAVEKHKIVLIQISKSTTMAWWCRNVWTLWLPCVCLCVLFGL